MTKYYIVWNPTRTEGFITDDPDDAHFASTGERLTHGVSNVGESFYETYSDISDSHDPEFEVDELEIER